MKTETATYIAAADIAANQADVFEARGEAYPAENGWTYQGVIGTRRLLGEYDNRAEAQAACDKWAKAPAQHSAYGTAARWP